MSTQRRTVWTVETTDCEAREWTVVCSTRSARRTVRTARKLWAWCNPEGEDGAWSGSVRVRANGHLLSGFTRGFAIKCPGLVSAQEAVEALHEATALEKSERPPA